MDAFVLNASGRGGAGRKQREDALARRMMAQLSAATISTIRIVRQLETAS